MRTNGEILAPREKQIAELVAWGASAKEVPSLLAKRDGGPEISVNTVTNTLRNIFAKLNIQKASELSAWWFCNYEGVDSSHSPLKREIMSKIYAVAFLLILLPQISNMDQAIRPSNSRTARVERVVRSGRRKE